MKHWDKNRPLGEWLSELSSVLPENQEAFDFLLVASDRGEKYEYGYVPLSNLENELVGAPNKDVACAIDFMQRFDRVSMCLQADHNKQLKGICIGALVFLLCFEIYAHLSGPFPQIDQAISVLQVTRYINTSFGLWIVLVIGVAAFLYSLGLQRGGQGFRFWEHNRSRQTQMAYLDSRCVSEIARIMVFWRLNGIGDRVWDLIPRTCEPRLNLVKRIVHRFDDDLGPSSEPVDGAMELTQREWELDQVVYFQEASAKQHLRHRFWTDVSALLFSTGLEGIMALIAFSLAKVPFESPIIRFLLIIVPSLIVCSAITEFYLERKGFESNVARYKHAEEIFRSDVIPGIAMSDLGPSKKVSKSLTWLPVGLTAMCLLGLVWSICTSTSNLMYFFGPVLFIELAIAIPICAVIFYWYELNANLKQCGVSDETKREWSSHRIHVGSEQEWERHVRSVGKEAFHEVIHWYIASSDRVVSLPKG